jgi:hypothetical protein
MSLGIGYLISSALSYRLAAILGILERPAAHGRNTQLT